MALTEKGVLALKAINTYFNDGSAFSAKDLSDKSNIKIAAATLNSVAKQGYLEKLGGSPVEYKIVDMFSELMEHFDNEESHKGGNNSNLSAAKKEKNDEFYTRYEDIEAEAMKYRKQFRNKIVYLPCDDPADKKSEFWSFFVNNFDAFGLQKLIATHYDENGKAYKIWIDTDTTGDGYIDDSDAMQEDLEGNGDFRSEECTAILNESDIVVTNPPFSLFREFVAWIINANKQFLIIGNQNTFTNKDFFPLLKNNQVWTGYNMVKHFYQPDGSIKDFGNVCWFTNLKTVKRTEPLVLTSTYSEIEYPKYDNYDAINVDRVTDIPKDYNGIMGVPITFLDKYNPEQFEIIWQASGNTRACCPSDILYNTLHYVQHSEDRGGCGVINGQRKYSRILIRRK